MIIRKAKLEDYVEIQKLNKEEMEYEFSIEDTRKQLKKIISSQKDLFLVATINDKVVGYIHANDYDCTYAPHMKNIMGIAVSSDYKRQGIGKGLLSSVEKWGLEDNAEMIRLVSGSERKEAHMFYTNCGYNSSKQQKNFKKRIK